MPLLIIALIAATMLMAIAIIETSYVLLGLSLLLYFISWIVIRRIMRADIPSLDDL